MRYAHITNSIVDDCAGNDPFALFRNSYAAEFISCPDEVQTGWLYEDDVFIPPPPEPETVPQIITPRQCRLQLLAETLLDEVETAIGTMPQAAQIEWEYALEVKRTYGLVVAMQALLDKDDNEMDEFFLEASKL